MFIGLGFPYEGPAPLEAIANGCHFLNPKFNPPLSAANTKFFKSKPTLRQLTSQNPYMESFIGKPHVYSLNVQNLKEVESALIEISSEVRLPCIMGVVTTPTRLLFIPHTHVEPLSTHPL